MTCKRQGEARSDLHTLAGASRLDNIRCWWQHEHVVDVTVLLCLVSLWIVQCQLHERGCTDLVQARRLALSSL